MPEYLKGFSDFGYFTGVTDTAAEYKIASASTRVSAAGTVSCSRTDNKTQTSIPADDDPNWDRLNEWEYTDLEIILRQLSLADLAALTGNTIATSSALEEGILDDAPTVALNFRAPKRGGGYRGYRSYNAQLQSYECNLQTSGTSAGQVADVTLRFRCKGRLVDGKVRGTQDFTTAALCSTWLASIPTVPAPTQGT